MKSDNSNHLRRSLALLAAVIAIVQGCGSSEPGGAPTGAESAAGAPGLADSGGSQPQDSTPGDSDASSHDSPAAAADSGGSGGSAGTGGTGTGGFDAGGGGSGGVDLDKVNCAMPPPPGAPTPPPMPTYSGGTCPALVPGTNTLTSGGAARKFILVVPAGYDPAKEKAPVMVMWHYIGGAADSMLKHGQAQPSADSLRVIIAIPEKKGDLSLPFYPKADFAWPYLDIHPAARVQEEVRFFDDMLACIGQQFPVNESCVSTVGVSAGALWVSQLMQLRSERLASAIVISGGVGPAPVFGTVDVRPWVGAKRALPAIVGWGGPTDRCGIDFNKASGNLIGALGPGGHFLVECIHNCGHAVPPVDDQVAGLAALYRFALDHPYWLAFGKSPYQVNGLPAGVPSWCGIGAGSATARTGACPQTSLDSQCPPI